MDSKHDGDVTTGADESIVIEFAGGEKIDLGTPEQIRQAFEDDEREILRQVLALHGLATDDADDPAGAGPDNPGWAKVAAAMWGGHES
jgi:hypothetical protein